MTGRKRIFLTTPYEAIRGMATDIDPNIETCMHFTGLYYGWDGHHDEVEFYQDLARLATLVRNEKSPLVVLGAWDARVPNSTFDIASFLLRNTTAEAIIAIAGRKTDRFSGDIEILKITQHGTRCIFRSRVHEDELWKRILRAAREEYDCLPETVKQKAA